MKYVKTFESYKLDEIYGSSGNQAAVYLVDSWIKKHDPEKKALKNILDWAEIKKNNGAVDDLRNALEDRLNIMFYDKEIDKAGYKKYVDKLDKVLKPITEATGWNELNEAKVKEGDRVKLVYPKYDNDKWAQAFNGQTGEVYSKGDDKNMWYVRLDNPVKIDGVDDPVKTDMWDQSYLKKIK